MNKFTRLVSLLATFLLETQLQNIFKPVLLFVGILLSLNYTTTVIGAGFQLQERSIRGMGRALSGEAAICDDASAIASNPACMVLLNDNSFSFGLIYITPDSDVSGQVPTGQVKDNNVVPDVFVPNFYGSKKLSEKIVFGMGVFSLYGLKTNYSNTFANSAISNLSWLETINFNPSIAYRINKQLSVGAGFNALYVKKGRITGNMTPFTPNNFSFKGNDWGFGYNVGILYEFNNDTRFGLHYRSKVDLTISGTYSGAFSGGLPTGAKIPIELPATLEFSALHKFDDQWSLHGDFFWTDWSAFKTLATKSPTEINNTANWKDTVRLSIGTTYKYNDKLIIRGGFAYDESPIRSAKFRTLRVADDDRYWLSIGTSYQIYKTYHIDLAYTHFFHKQN